MWNYKNGTDEPVCEAERDIDKRTNKWTPRRKGEMGWIERLGLKYTHYYV